MILKVGTPVSEDFFSNTGLRYCCNDNDISIWEKHDLNFSQKIWIFIKNKIIITLKQKKGGKWSELREINL